ncbi:MAG: hypothetical protein Q9175_001934 [Cornicularia normoerica]
MVKTYFLAPTRDCPPSGPIALGNIIASPSLPEEALNLRPALPIRPIYESYQTNWTAEVGRRRHGKIGLWTKFLQVLGVGIDFSVNYDIGKTDIYDFDRVETRFFAPDKVYIEESMSSSEVREFIVRSKFRANVYMITGIKVAIGASVTSTKLRQRGIHVQLGVDGTAVGVPLGLGPDVEVSSGRTHGISFDGASDFVFAFRLREIIYSKRQGIVHREFSKGALFGLEDDHRESAVERQEEVPVDFELLAPADEDVSAEDVDLEASAIVDDDGEVCECLIVD